MPNNSTSSLFGRLSARSSFMSPKEVKVNVQLMNDSDSISNEFKRSLPAQSILDYVCELRGIRTKDYLGLRYQDQYKHRYWVDLSKPISHVIKNFKNDSLNLFLRFRYYPADPTHIHEPGTRYQLFAQLQRDLIHGRLHCPQQKAAELGGLILQAQLGDYDPIRHPDNYVSQYTLLLKQTPRTEEKIVEYHQSFRGMRTDEAERTFLERAGELDTYGFDPYSIKDPKDQSDVYIGVNHRGLLIFQRSQLIHNIPWSQLIKIDYLGKELRIIPTESYCSFQNGEPREMDRDKKSRHVIKYICPSGHYAKHLWNHILSQQAFFNEQSAIMIKPKFSKPRIPLISRGSTFRFPSRRVLREIESDEAQTLSDGEMDKNATMDMPITSFSRYDLPKHEPRQPQPWLNHTEKTVVVPNGDVRREEVESPDPARTSRGNSLLLFNETVANSPMLGSPSSVPSTTISSPETPHVPEPEDHLSDGKPLENGDIDEPLLTSTPIFHVAETKLNGKKNGTANGNGTIRREDEVPVTTAVSRTVTNTLFTSFLLLLLFVALAIAIFERQESRDFVEASPWLSHMRHQVYEPARHYILRHYGKFSRR